MFKPVQVKALPDYKLWLKYSDGVAGEVDLSHLAGKGVFALWDDYAAFDKSTLAKASKSPGQRRLTFAPMRFI